MKILLSIIFLFASLFYGCALQSDSIIDAGSPPSIIQYAVSPQILNFENIFTIGNTIDTTIAISVTVNGGTNTSVVYKIFTPKNTLFKQGTLSEVTSGKFTASVALKFPKDIPGGYQVQFQAYSSENFTSNNITVPIIVKTKNNPPELFNLFCLDTVTVPTGSAPNLIRVSISVKDSQGLADIEYVRLQSYRADSSSAGIFDLYDDGGKKNQFFGIPSGDSIANDGRYTLEIPLFNSVNPSEPRNKYRDFEFYAKDFSGSFSNIIRKRVYLK